MSFEPWQWLLVGIAAFLVGVAKAGIAGIGILFVGIFANIMPTKESSGFVLPLLIFGDIAAVAMYRAHTQWSHLWRLFPWTGVGVLIGYFAMDALSDRQARVLIGGIICTMAALHAWKRWCQTQPAPAPGPSVAASTGMLAGFTTLVANAAGPLMALYLLAMRLPKMQFVGTGAVFFLLLNVFKVPFMVDLGLVTQDSFKVNLMMAPLVLGGAVLGRRIVGRIDQKLFETLALGLSALAGLRLLF